MEEKILEIAEKIFEDIKLLDDVEPKERIGAEIMALNALCNAYRLVE